MREKGFKSLLSLMLCGLLIFSVLIMPKPLVATSVVVKYERMTFIEEITAIYEK